MIINLLSGPRNISTALMYSFAQRSDTKVIDEPFYGYYLKATDVDHPGKEETMSSMSCDYEKVVQTLDNTNHQQVLFLKNMAHHMIMEDISFINSWKNIFLIREPKQLIASFSKVIPNPKMSDIGLKKEWELFKYLSDKNTSPVVIDSNEILKNPRKVLNRVCESIGLAFEPQMLQWEAGPRPEDGTWAKYWYKNVHSSTGFSAPVKKEAIVPDHLGALLEEAEQYFNLLKQHAITA